MCLQMAGLGGEGWGCNEPERLYQLLLHYCATHLNTVTAIDEATQTHSLHPGLTLPTQIADPLLRQVLVTYREEVVDKYLAAFSEPERCHLRQVSLRDCRLSLKAFRSLLHQHLIELDLTRCSVLYRDECLRLLQSHARHLRVLNMGDLLEHAEESDAESPPAVNLLCSRVAQNIGAEVGEDVVDIDVPVWPQLQALTVMGCREWQQVRAVLQPLNRLTYLELSGCSVQGNLLDSVEHLSDSLHTLILYNVPDAWHHLKPITWLKQLR